MANTPISAHDPHPRHRADVGGVEIAYVDTGGPHPNPLPEGEGVIVFLHGNPTSSYLWRNIIPQVSPLARCLAPDLMGMGESDATPDGSYRFADHSRYLDAWFDAVLPDRPVMLVAHDWGSALGFHWAHRHPERVRGLVYMEAIVRPVTWDEWPEAAKQVFQGFRSEAGESMVLERNIFVEAGAARQHHQRHQRRGDGGLPPPLRRARRVAPSHAVLAPRIPIEGEPPDVVALVSEYAEWLSQTQTPKLFVNAEPGAILTGPQREFCRAFPNQREVTVPGVHFIQEDSPHEIGAAIAEWYAGL